MNMVEASIQKMQEGMMTVTQRQGAPTFRQQVILPARQQKYSEPPVKPTSTQQIIVDGLTWHVCSNCKRMGTHADDNCWTLPKNAAKKVEFLKECKETNREAREKDHKEAKKAKSRPRSRIG